MLKKLVAALNPFHVKRVAAPKDEPSRTDAHPHSFSCACKLCNDETGRLTRERLRSQGVSR